ncbi:hypothetical protein BOTNAR_0423g00020 [Botryotinia narcissicola]|uniref:2EXR domain-containing protein n=1 Tax=Botryotinia narcissicola TaxID=278944 RepID=A0A4Z1HSH1_9HELO|nr:hypothetical protein BOTNAR_0423g00020 [Botryotinia narcissicola]
MDGSNPPSWPPDNQNSRMPGAEKADYEIGRPMELDGHPQQTATSYYLPNELPMGSTAEEYNQLQPGDTAPSNFQFNRYQQLITPCVNQLPRFSNSLGFANGNTDGYAFPTFVPPNSLHVNPPLNTNPTQLAFMNQGGSPSYFDSRMASSQPAVFDHYFNTFPTRLASNKQVGSPHYPKSKRAPKRSANFKPPLNTSPNQVAFCNQGGGLSYLDPRIARSQSPFFGPPLQTLSTIDSHLGTMEITAALNPAFDQWGLKVSNPDYLSHNSDVFGFGSRQTDVQDDPGLNRNERVDFDDDFKYRTSKLFSDLPPKVQILIWKHPFPAGRAAFIDYASCPSQLKIDERRTGLPITLAICKISRQVTLEHYTIVDRHREGIRTIYTKPFCFNPEVDTLCITYDFIEACDSERIRNDWYDKVDKALKKKGVLKGVGLKGVRFLDFLPRLYKNSFLSRFEKLDRLVFTSACPIDDWLLLSKTVALEGLGECELFGEELAKYLEEKWNSHKGKLVAKEDIIVREYQAPQGISTLENLEKMCWLF